MKKIHFPIYLLCFFLMAIDYGCEKADLQKAVVTQEPVVPRDPTIECDDCPVDYCCCAIQWLETDPNPVFTFCGVYSPNMSTTPCSDTWGLCAISGYLLNIGLSTQYDLDLFCAAPNSAFSVSSMANGTARISCHYGQGGSTSTDVTFPGKRYVFVDDSCDVSQHCQ
jgi:hypothetical protein